MTKHFCDACKKEVKDRLYPVDILCHVKKSPTDLTGRVHLQVNKSMERDSGRIETTELCIVCYNKVMYPLWDSIKEIQDTNTIEQFFNPPNN